MQWHPELLKEKKNVSVRKQVFLSLLVKKKNKNTTEGKQLVICILIWVFLHLAYHPVCMSIKIKTLFDFCSYQNNQVIM